MVAGGDGEARDPEATGRPGTGGGGGRGGGGEGPGSAMGDWGGEGPGDGEAAGGGGGWRGVEWRGAARSGGGGGGAARRGVGRASSTAAAGRRRRRSGGGGENNGREENEIFCPLRLDSLASAKMPPKVALLEREWNDTFGHSECTDAYLVDNFTSNFGPRASARSPGSSLVPRPSAGEAVVFLEFFKYGLRVPAHPFVAQVLKAFQLEIHHLTPNAIAKLAIYVWACRSQGFEPSVSAFAFTHRVHFQPTSKVRSDSFGVVNFVHANPKNVPAFGQANKVTSHWKRYWFYPPKWLIQVDVDHDDDFEGCIDSLGKIRPLLSCRDLVEEYISAGVDPLRPNWDLQFAESLYANGLRKYVLASDALSVPEVEELAKEIVGPYVDKEEAGRQEAGIPAHFNRSFAARDQPYEDYGAPVPKRKRSSKATVFEEPEPSRKRHRKNAPGPARKHLRKAALNVKPISVAPPRGSTGAEGSPDDHAGEDCSSEEDPFGELPRFRISEDDDPIEFALDSDYKGHGLPSLTPSELWETLKRFFPILYLRRKRKQLSGVHYGYLFQALYANQVKRFRETRSELREKDFKERKVSSSLFKACKDLKDCLLYLGGEVQDFPLPNASNREFAEWISANSSFAKSTAENFGVLAGAAGIEEAFAQLSLCGGSVDPILDEGFSPAKELPDPIPDEARSSFFKMAPHWQEVGSGRVSSFVEKVRRNQNSAASDDAADDVPEDYTR
ncbi:hypothetical protein EJB05_34733, partial [Eragrostis curvula]